MIDDALRPADDSAATYTCGSCGYGVSSCPPAACPICRSSTWLTAGSLSRADVTVNRLAHGIFLITTPRIIDAATSAVVGEALAALAPAAPDVVLDLTGLREIDETAVRMILRLSALTRGAGGRLLLLCADDETTFHDLGADDDPRRAAGEFGSAVRRLDAAGAL